MINFLSMNGYGVYVFSALQSQPGRGQGERRLAAARCARRKKGSVFYSTKYFEKGRGQPFATKARRGYLPWRNGSRANP